MRRGFLSVSLLFSLGYNVLFVSNEIFYSSSKQDSLADILPILNVIRAKTS